MLRAIDIYPTASGWLQNQGPICTARSNAARASTIRSPRGKAIAESQSLSTDGLDGIKRLAESWPPSERPAAVVKIKRRPAIVKVGLAGCAAIIPGEL